MGIFRFGQRYGRGYYSKLAGGDDGQPGRLDKGQGLSTVYLGAWGFRHSEFCRAENLGCSCSASKNEGAVSTKEKRRGSIQGYLETIITV